MNIDEMCLQFPREEHAERAGRVRNLVGGAAYPGIEIDELGVIAAIHRQIFHLAGNQCASQRVLCGGHLGHFGVDSGRPQG